MCADVVALVVIVCTAVKEVGSEEVAVASLDEWRSKGFAAVRRPNMRMSSISEGRSLQNMLAVDFYRHPDDMSDVRIVRRGMAILKTRTKVLSHEEVSRQLLQRSRSADPPSKGDGEKA